jgi:E3 Ubiquitin ligase
MLTQIFLLIGLVAGLLWFFEGLRIYRKQRVLADTPESTLLGIAMGFVEVHGKAKPAKEGTVNSPVTRTPCLFYKVQIKGYSGDEGRKMSHHITDADGVPFYLEDGTGKVLVEAHGAEFDLLRTSWRETGGISMRGIVESFRDLHSPPKFLVDDNELINYAESLSKSYAPTRRYQFTEYCLLPGHWYNVAGTCIENPDTQDRHDRNMIVKGLDIPTFMITWRTEAGIKHLLRVRAAKYVFGGGILAILSLALTLSKLGWL